MHSLKRSLGGAIVVDLCTAKVALAGVIWLCPMPYLGAIQDFVPESQPPKFIEGYLSTGMLVASRLLGRNELFYYQTTSLWPSRLVCLGVGA
jgi:hypothetical protein